MTDDITPRIDENRIPWCSDWECYKHQPNPPQPHCYNAYSVCSELEDRAYGDPPVCPVAVARMAELSERRAAKLRGLIFAFWLNDNPNSEHARAMWTDLDLGPLPPELEGNETPTD